MRRRRAVVRRPGRTERGFTLVEVMITVALLGSAVISMVGTLYTVTTVSDQQRRTSIVDAEGRRFAEKVRAMDYKHCASADDINQQMTAVPDVTASVTAVQYWQGTFTPPRFSSADWSSPGDPCVKDCGMQQITVQVSEGNVSTQMSFVKRADDAYLPAC